MGVPTYLGLGATSASDGRGEGAGPTAAFVAHLLTQMDGVWNNTGSNHSTLHREHEGVVRGRVLPLEPQAKGLLHVFPQEGMGSPQLSRLA